MLNHLACGKADLSVPSEGKHPISSRYGEAEGSLKPVIKELKNLEL